jgi:hypothetical protein
MVLLANFTSGQISSYQGMLNLVGKEMEGAGEQANGKIISLKANIVLISSTAAAARRISRLKQ